MKFWQRPVGTALARRGAPLTLFGALATWQDGCVSFSYIDSQNRRHVVGFVDLEIDSSPADSTKTQAKVTSFSSVGLHVYSGGDGTGGVIVGYAQNTWMLAWISTEPD